MSEDHFLKVHLPGASAAMKELRQMIEMINSSFNRDLLRVILVTGESGAGKNHVARVIAGHRHWRDSRAADERTAAAPLAAFTSQFAEISLPTLPDSLVESELFGYRQGAFTGASKDHKGLLAGDAVDVLLDEIGDASPLVQSKLLGVLETRRFRPVGGGIDDESNTDARFLVATHRDLGQLVREGGFREDLFWRTNELTITVPPLREQAENVPDLIDYQLGILGPRALYDCDPAVDRPLPEMSSDDLEWARTYAWPGNVRQLRHVLVQWLAHGGQVPLRNLALNAEIKLFEVSGGRQQASQRRIYERLRTARSAGRLVAPTLGALIDEARREIELEVVEWYDKDRPTLDELRTLFPEAKPTAIRSKLSQWRNE
jgi:DNA-binding NtrC family response regulator